MRRTERVAYRTKFYSNLSSPTRFDEEPTKLNRNKNSFFKKIPLFSFFIKKIQKKEGFSLV
ncbi:hypothetical protein AUF15_01525 [Enterococcus avium]|nr:hypothetical protein AUF15_01525 [Enterococcus avium]TXV43079.1 hypothetical protein D4M89_17255 [Enterococcus sp. T0101B.F-10]